MNNSNIPHELVFEILKRLPAKSLMRFRCVSKSFGSLTSEPLFIEAHRQSRVDQSLVCYIALNNKYVIYNLGSQDDLGCVTNCPFNYLDDQCFRNLDYSSGSINGIFCLWNNIGDIAICNPFIKEHVFLPNPWTEKKFIASSISMTCCSLGFDPTINKLIVLKVDLVIPDKLQVSNWIFTIGIDKSWRKAYVNIPNFFPRRKDSVCIDGVIYFLNLFEPGNIVAFSVGAEKVIRTILLSDEVRRGYSPKLLDVKGQVAVLVKISNFRVMYLHVVQNETIRVKQSIELPSELLVNTPCIPFFTTNLKGELLSISTYGISPLLIYDIRRKNWRIVEIHEIQERKYTSGNHLGVALNHEESIWSLR